MKTFVLILLCLALGACDKPAADAQPPAHPHPHEAEPAKKEGAAKDAPAADESKKVEVPAAGAKFDPAIKPQQLSEGAWFCDMGTVHWAQMDKAEKCPECGMALKQFKAADYAGHAEQAPHDHGAGAHDHPHPEEKEKPHAHGEDGDHEHGDDHGHKH